MVLLVRWILFALAIVFVAWLVPGIEVENFQSAMLVTVIIALINIFIRPLIVFITLPINILTLGIFTLVINALLLMLAGYLAPGVDVEGFLSAFIGSVVLAFLVLIINMVTIDKAD
uniref:phage holin family protein n=1 Tax=Candidatus Stercorousia sp. TaxID=3048886 RepID=UPI004024E916